MERLTQRIESARRALAALEELTTKATLTRVERDAAIQRFEFTFEAVWKAVQLHLREAEGVDIGSPKAAARASLQVGLLDERQTNDALTMTDDRNLTVHTYNEQIAEQIVARLSKHSALLRVWLDRITRTQPEPQGV